MRPWPAALPLLVGACFNDLPDLDATATATTTTATTTTTTTTPATSTSTTSTGGPTATTDTTTGTSGDTTAPASATDATSVESTTSGPSTGSSGSTAPLEPFTLELPASLATCAVLANALGPHLGGLACESHITAVHNSAPGVMAVDTSLDADQTMRSIRSFLRFDPPADLGGTIVDARLRIVVEPAANSGGPQSGDIHTAGPFDAASLASAAPDPQELVAPSLGAVTPTQVILWSLPPGIITPGDPLHLTILPLTTDGVLYRSSAAPDASLRPRLVLTIQP